MSNVESFHLDAVRAAAERAGAGDAAADWYRVGGAYVGVRAGDGPFRARFRTLFEECSCAPPDGTAASRTVRCTAPAMSRGEPHVVRFEDPEPCDAARFALDIFHDRAYHAADLAPGWTLLRRGRESVAVSADSIVARGQGWRSFAGSFAISRAIRLQRDALFFHAAAVAWRGRGMLLLGAKGSGKTTLALGMAARGHAFLGDELVGVGTDLSLLPVRRAVSIREGPRAAAVTEALRQAGAASERFPDGGRRIRTTAGRLLPNAGATPARLTVAVLLGGFASDVRIDRVRPGAALLSTLAPLPASLWGSPPGVRALRTLSLFARVDCRALIHGPVEETLDRLTQLLEGRCR